MTNRIFYKVCEKALRKVRRISHGGRGSSSPLLHAGGNASKPLLTPYDSIGRTSKMMISDRYFYKVCERSSGRLGGSDMGGGVHHSLSVMLGEMPRSLS